MKPSTEHPKRRIASRPTCVPWVAGAVVCLLFAGALSPSLISPLLPAKAHSIHELFLAGLQLLRLGLVAVAALSLVTWRCLTRWNGFAPAHATRDCLIWTHSDTTFAAVLVAAAMVLRLPNLADSLWWDEINSLLRTVRRGLPVIFAFSADGNNHLLNSLSMYGAAKLLGEWEWALRLPAFLMGSVTPAASYMLLRDIFPLNVVRCVSWLLVISFPAIVFSTEARGYAGAVLFSLLTSALFVRLTRSPSRLLALLYPIGAMFSAGFLASALCLPLTHAAAALAFLLRAAYRRYPDDVLHHWGRVFLICVWGVAVSGVLLAPTLPQLLDYSRHRAYLAHPVMSVDVLWDTFYFSTGVRHAAVAFAIVAASVTGWFHYRPPTVLIAAFIAPFGVQLLAFWAKQSHVSPRLFAPVLVSLLLGASLLVCYRSNARWSSVATALIIAGVIAGSSPNYLTFYNVGQPELRELAQELGERDILLTGRQADMNTFYFPGAVWIERDSATAVRTLGQTRYVLEGFDCARSPGLQIQGFAYRHVKTFGDWTAPIQRLHPGHVCFNLYQRIPEPGREIY